MQATLALLVLAVGAASAQFFQSSGPAFEIQPPPFQQQAIVPVAIHQQQQQQQQQQRPLAHRAVVQNAQAESQLPPHLLNNFYKNPRIVSALARESWFTADEMQVFEREAEKIPRAKVYSILHNAGLARR